jgi:hypothetical protein
MGVNPYSGSLMMGSFVDVDGNMVPMGDSQFRDWDDLYEDYSATQPPLSKRQQQEATERIARERAKFDATRNMAMFAFAVILGLITAIFIAPSFF